VWFKKTLILSTLCVLLINSYGQDQVLFQPIKVSFKDISVDSALKIIEHQIDLNFTYNSVYTSENKMVNAIFNQTPLSIVLDSLFSNPFLTYKILDKQLVIYEEITEQKVADQNAEDVVQLKTYTINGSIVDKKSYKSIPFAAIGFLKRNKGTISNNDGYFALTYNENYLNDTLLISHLGYSQLVIPVAELRPDSVYELSEHSISLQEVIIRSTDPRSLILQALGNKTLNYDVNPFIHRAFYRETVKRNDRFMVYTEAIFDVFKTAYRPTIFNDQFKLIKQRKFTDVNSQDTVLFKLHGGLSTSLMLDVLKHPIDFLDEERIYDYSYSIRDVVIINNELAYLIEFRPNRPSDEMSFKGDVYVDISSMSIVKVNFKYTRESIKKLKNSFIIKQSRSIKAQPVDAEYSISYKKHHNGLYYINHIKGCLKLKVKKKRKLLSSIYETSFEMVSTDINTSDVSRFSRRETIHGKRVFSDLSDSYNTNYWGDEVFIVPEADLSKALLRFKQEELSLEQK
jgi:hypothetical protein